MQWFADSPWTLCSLESYKQLHWIALGSQRKGYGGYFQESWGTWNQGSHPQQLYAKSISDAVSAARVPIFLRDCSMPRIYYSPHRGCIDGKQKTIVHWALKNEKHWFSWVRSWVLLTVLHFCLAQLEDFTRMLRNACSGAAPWCHANPCQSETSGKRERPGNWKVPFPSLL